MPKILNGTQNVLDILNANGLFDQLWKYVGKDSTSPLPRDTITKVLIELLSDGFGNELGVKQAEFAHKDSKDRIIANTIDNIEGEISSLQQKDQSLENSINNISEMFHNCLWSEIDNQKTPGFYWIKGRTAADDDAELMIVGKFSDSLTLYAQYYFYNDQGLKYRVYNLDEGKWTEWKVLSYNDLSDKPAINMGVVSINDLDNYKETGAYFGKINTKQQSFLLLVSGNTDLTKVVQVFISSALVTNFTHKYRVYENEQWGNWENLNSYDKLLDTPIINLHDVSRTDLNDYYEQGVYTGKLANGNTQFLLFVSRLDNPTTTTVQQMLFGLIQSGVSILEKRQGIDNGDGIVWDDKWTRVNTLGANGSAWFAGDVKVGSNNKKLLTDDDISEVAISGDYNDLMNKPVHNVNWLDIDSLYGREKDGIYKVLGKETSGTVGMGNSSSYMLVMTNVSGNVLQTCQYLIHSDGKSQYRLGTGTGIEDWSEWKSVGVTSYNDLTDKPSLSAVATSGSYKDLSDEPIILTNTTTIDELITPGLYWYNDGVGYSNYFIIVSTTSFYTDIDGYAWEKKIISQFIYREGKLIKREKISLIPVENPSVGEPIYYDWREVPINDNLVTKDVETTEISDSSTHSKIPTALAVKNYVDSAIGDALEGSY